MAQALLLGKLPAATSTCSRTYRPTSATGISFLLTEWSLLIQANLGNPNRYATVRDIVEEMYDHMSNRAFGVAPADDDLILLGDVSQTVTNRIRGTTWQNVEESLEVDAMDSGTATDGQVATADGSGGIDWEAGSGSFNLHDDVTTNIGNNLNLSDRMVISDESIGRRSEPIRRSAHHTQ